MKTGTVLWFNDSKGFGFITPDDKSAPVFAHFSAIERDGYRTLYEKERVSYRLVNGHNGSQAMDIRLLDSVEIRTHLSKAQLLSEMVDHLVADGLLQTWADVAMNGTSKK